MVPEDSARYRCWMTPSCEAEIVRMGSWLPLLLHTLIISPIDLSCFCSHSAVYPPSPFGSWILFCIQIEDYSWLPSGNVSLILLWKVADYKTLVSTEELLLNISFSLSLWLCLSLSLSLFLSVPLSLPLLLSPSPSLSPCLLSPSFAISPSLSPCPSHSLTLSLLCGRQTHFCHRSP